MLRRFNAETLGPFRERGYESRCKKAAGGDGPPRRRENATSVTADTILVQDNEPIPATVEADVVLLSLRAGAYFGLNKVGTEIWNMLAEPRRAGDIYAALAQTHDVDADTIARDVSAFLDGLLKRRLVRVVGPGEAR